jgi:DNA adenine methylase
VSAPFIKSAGGKRRLLSRLLRYYPQDCSNIIYHELCLGGGALFFALAGRGLRAARLNDANLDLCSAYWAVQSDVDALVDLLRTFQNTQEFYSAMRSVDPTLDKRRCFRGARFIYLNKTGFSGLWRENAAGLHNTPFGRYPNPKFCDARALRDAAHTLNSAADRRVAFSITNLDVVEALRAAKPGEYVYVDPPYYPVKKDSFVKYQGVGFTIADQDRLATAAWEAASRGVKVLLSNADIPPVRELYSDFFLEEIAVGRPINSDTGKRGRVPELIISSYVESACAR